MNLYPNDEAELEGVDRFSKYFFFRLPLKKAKPHRYITCGALVPIYALLSLNQLLGISFMAIGNSYQVNTTWVISKIYFHFLSGKA